MRITGNIKSVPTSRKACVLGEDAASQSVKWYGTTIGQRLIAMPRLRQQEHHNRDGERRRVLRAAECPPFPRRLRRWSEARPVRQAGRPATTSTAQPRSARAEASTRMTVVTAMKTARRQTRPARRAQT